MPVHLYVAPAAAGKTTYLLESVHKSAQGLAATPRVCLAGRLQVRAWRRRLARSGGAIGVRLLRFDQLYAECLGAAGEIYTQLSEPVQYRLIRAVVDELSLRHYAPLVGRPGFIQALQQLLAELKAAQIWPISFADAVAALGDEPRLRELAQIYTRYQEYLQAKRWADRAGMGWLAVEALEERATQVARDWPLLVVDGFDNFTPVQIAMLQILADRVGELVITLTGVADDDTPRTVHRRFLRTREQLESALGVRAVPLPSQRPPLSPVLAHLEAELFQGEASQVAATGTVDLIEAPDRAAEVRAALRWLKARRQEDGVDLDDLALLARDIVPYRPFILQTAAEFGLPIRLVDGLPLRANPAMAALLDLLRLMLPRGDGETEPALPYRLVIEAWRCPYFDWSAQSTEGASPIGIVPGDAEALNTAARWGRVIGGRTQWEEALTALAGHTTESRADEERDLPSSIPIGDAAQDLLAKLRRFLHRLTPPQGQHPYRDFVGWLEALIGPDPTLAGPHYAAPEEPTSLRIMARARESTGTAAELDVAALQALKDVLRGLVWAEEAVTDSHAVEFPRFFADMVGAIESTSYRPPLRPEGKEITVANVIQARGVPYRAVAVLGLAEGEFPTTLTEDVLLRNADRSHLTQDLGLALDLPTDSAEREFFYETITRPWERLLLTRPRLADNGALWQASPFWEELLRLLSVQAESLSSASLPWPHQAASWSELMESLAHYAGHSALQEWVQQERPSRYAGLVAAAKILHQREAGTVAGPFAGDLSALAEQFADSFGPDHTWSASRLENYATCPFFFFVRNVLGLELEEEPAEGLDARQLGTIYHRIFEELYPEVHDPTDLDQLMAALPAVAGRILDQAPQREGFRATAWWAQTREEIVDNVRRSLEALAALPGTFAPYRHEAAFGLKGEPTLVISDGPDRLRLRGFIDRVDKNDRGELRIIDYKTGGPSGYSKKAVIEGKKLQLPLYALAARDALGWGEPVEGFYWHVRQAQPSSFTLTKFEGGSDAAIKVAVDKAWEAVRGVRRGHFVPRPPEDRCPPYCPAAGFCWRYDPGYG